VVVLAAVFAVPVVPVVPPMVPPLLPNPPKSVVPAVVPSSSMHCQALLKQKQATDVSSALYTQFKNPVHELWSAGIWSGQAGSLSGSGVLPPEDVDVVPPAPLWLLVFAPVLALLKPLPVVVVAPFELELAALAWLVVPAPLFDAVPFTEVSVLEELAPPVVLAEFEALGLWLVPVA